MKNSKLARNIKVVAINNESRDGFSIYLDFSGRREFVVSHRHNALLYSILCGGIHLDDLRRWRPKASQRQVNGKLVNLISHSLKVIDWYLAERELFGKLAKDHIAQTQASDQTSEFIHKEGSIWAA